MLNELCYFLTKLNFETKGLNKFNRNQTMFISTH